VNVEAAYERCRTITRAAARNFYYGFVLLPNPRRAGIYAAYAFARRADDAVDEEGPLDAKLAAVASLRRELDATYAGSVSGDDEVLLALADTVRRFAIPRQHFDALIDGVAMDLTTTRYASFAELEPYCDRVAGAVGLISLHIFGFENPEAPDHAADLGVGMQIVNIMRDVAEDAERDRIYLPQDEMAAHGVTDADILAGVTTPQMRSLLRAQGDRARQYFASGEALLPMLDRRARACVSMLGGLYRAILDEIEVRDYDVMSERVALSTPRKLALMGQKTITTLTPG
jgi:15-cis-phytoene synthase